MYILYISGVDISAFTMVLLALTISAGVGLIASLGFPKEHNNNRDHDDRARDDLILNQLNSTGSGHNSRSTYDHDDIDDSLDHVMLETVKLSDDLSERSDEVSERSESG